MASKKKKWIITHEDGTEVPFEGDGHGAMKKGLEVGKHFMAEPIEDYEARKKREKEKPAEKAKESTGTHSVVKKTIHDYTGEELDELYESDPEEHERLWSEAELEAINNPDNHGKST